ncbi:MAG: PRC-barrel domain-containing protein [Chloroflexota bacterium]
MQFKDGTKVYSLDGQDVGRVDRVVLNPKTKEVTHLVVRKGFLFTQDKIVPLDLIASATEDRVELREDAGKLDDLLPFEETHYIPLDEADLRNPAYPVGTAAALYWYPPMGGWMGYGGGSGYAYPPPHRTETKQNIPQGDIVLNEGARVFSDSNQHVGNVTRVITESPSNQATYFLMSEGIFFKEKKRIPVSWIRKIQEGEIHLNVGTSVLDKLPEYQEAKSN